MDYDCRLLHFALCSVSFGLKAPIVEDFYDIPYRGQATAVPSYKKYFMWLDLIYDGQYS
jgi:hypothetical protein